MRDKITEVGRTAMKKQIEASVVHCRDAERRAFSDKNAPLATSMRTWASYTATRGHTCEHFDACNCAICNANCCLYIIWIIVDSICHRFLPSFSVFTAPFRNSKRTQAKLTSVYLAKKVSTLAVKFDRLMMKIAFFSIGKKRILVVGGQNLLIYSSRVKRRALDLP